MKRRSFDPQFDLFVPYVADMAIRDQRETMERPFFSLSKRKRNKPIEYTSPDSAIFVNVLPHQDFGMATIWDADILIWAASTLCEMKRRGLNDLPRKLAFQPYDLLRTIGRQTGGNRYAALRAALGRLQTTTIVTNLRVSKGKKHRQFAWIDSWSELIDEDGENSRGMSITLSDWFYEGVMMDGGVLSIDFEYFSITGGRERWLYRVARKHAGGAGPSGFTIGLNTLFEKAGAEGTYRRFKHEIAKIARANDLPGYDLSLELKREEPALTMRRRETGEGAAPVPACPRAKMGAGPGTAPRKPKTGPQGCSAAAAGTPLLTLMNSQLADETIARVRRSFPGWDVYAIQAEFDDWIAEAPEARDPDDYQGAFYGFARGWVERRRS